MTPLFIYDTKYNPLSFDVVHWLACCFLRSQDFNELGTFDVILVVDEYRDVEVEKTYDASYRERKTYSVLIKCISICKWVRNFTIVRDASHLVVAKGTTIFPVGWRPGLSLGNLKLPQHEVSPMTHLQVEALMTGRRFHRYGFDCEVERETFDTQNLILFHPRCTNFTPSRNTPIDMFKELQEDLSKGGFVVKCVPDLDDVLGRNLWAKHFDCLPHAASDPYLRLGLSLKAYANVVWAGGNIAPLVFSKSKFIMFGVHNESAVVGSKSFFERKGPVMGRSPLWFERYQVMDWTVVPDLTGAYVVDRVNRYLKDEI
jgi:hypothetical protein